MTPGSFRLFVAATPPRGHLEWVRERTLELESRWPEARWAPAENQHVTLKFLGATPPEAVDEIAAACRRAAAAVAPAEVGLGGLGAFPSARRARILWLGLSDPAGVLTALASQLEAALETLGFPPEERSFSPHLTLARFRAPANLAPLPDLAGDPPDPFLLTAFGLWRSHLSPKGARYEPLEEFGLGAADAR